jgi:hypothetical protein
MSLVPAGELRVYEHIAARSRMVRMSSQGQAWSRRSTWIELAALQGAEKRKPLSVCNEQDRSVEIASPANRDPP